MSERSFRVSPLRLALLAELAEGLAYECGSGDWPMQSAEATFRTRIGEIRAYYGDEGAPAREALKVHLVESEAAARADERAKVLAAVREYVLSNHEDTSIRKVLGKLSRMEAK